MQKSQFDFQLYDPYLAVMVHNYLKTQGQEINLTQFQAKCVSMFGTHIKTPKVKPTTSSISSSAAWVKHKTRSQKNGNQKDRKIQVLTELIAQQKQEIENLKAVSATGLSLQQLISVILYNLPLCVHRQ